MGIMRFNYRSEALGRYVDVTIALPTDNYTYYDMEKEKKGMFSENPVVPQNRKGVYRPGMKFQTVYLIHGGGDDDTLTYRYTNAERYAQDNNVMLVTPNVSNSFGVDTCYGVRYQTFIAEELPTVVRALFPSSDKREDNFIVGYAMGGNVALGTALMNQDNYAVCVDMSGGIGMTLDTQTIKDELDGDHFKNFLPLYNSTFGSSEGIQGSRFDMYSIAKKRIEDGAVLTKFYIICGSEEFIRARVERDVELMKELGYDLEYIVAEGYKHDFNMWEDYIRITLDSLLPLKRKSDL